MATNCPSCGAANDESSRFCDQCGAALDNASDAPASQAVSSVNCPSCGAAVLPGEAFCDECGADLKALLAAPAAAASMPAQAAAPDAPTMVVSTPSAEQGLVCAVCGHQNLPGDRFCDQCGAELVAAQPDTAAVFDPADLPLEVATGEGVTVQPAHDDVTQLSEVEPPAPADESVPVPPPADQAAPVPIEQAPAEPVAPPADEAAPMLIEQASAEPVPLPTDQTTPVPLEQASAAPVPPPADQAAEAALPSLTQEQYKAERARLEAEVTTQQNVVAQLESTQAALGAQTPAGVLQALAEAREALSAAEAQLAALVPPPPPVDPAERARLESQVTAQQNVVAQLESTQAVLGAQTPAGVLQALAEAREALSAAEARLAALLGTAPAPALAAPAPEPAPEASPVEASLPAPAPISVGPVEQPAPVPVAPAEQPAPLAPETQPVPTPRAQPRLVIEEHGVDLPLDGQRQHFIIGREDPISGIHPEIDLTPYGGESGGVSRQHARIERDGDQWTVTDLASTNYTKVDGARLDPNVPTPLSDGARLQFGRLLAVFRIA